MGKPIMTRDEEHLKLLPIFHYVVGDMAGVFSLIPIFHLVVGLVFIFAPQMSFDLQASRGCDHSTS